MAGKSKQKTKTELVPKLRFPEFEGDGVWQSPLFADLYAFKPTNTLSRDKLNYQAGTVRNIHYGDIHTKFSSLFDLREEDVPFVNDAAAADGFDDSCLCEEGDMVFADASEDLADVGKSIEIIRLHGERVISGTHTILATRKTDRPALGFGGYVFQCDYVRDQIRKEAQGSKVSGISGPRLSRIVICLPPTSAEQEKIAACLSSLDELIAAERRKLEALKAHKKGLMQQLFPRPGETRPRLRFPEFKNAGEWKKVPLGDLVDIASGQVDPKVEPYCDLPHVGGDNIESHTGKLLNLQTARELRLTSGKYYFDPNDVLYSKIRPALNKVAAPTFCGICSADIYPIRPSSDEILREYLVYLLLSETFLDYACARSARSKIPKVNREALCEYQARIPAAAEQNRIASCLSSLDSLLGCQSDKVDELMVHKRGLMQQLFPSLEEARG